ncbi:50S ribosomal protein L19, partial [Verrucomicrobiota bacterium]
MVSKIIEKISKENIKEDGMFSFPVGANVRVHMKIREGEKERVQVFAGVVIARKGGVAGTFTVRRISYGIGVERVFPVNSPNIVKVEVESISRVRRAKLYFLRQRA